MLSDRNQLLMVEVCIRELTQLRDSLIHQGLAGLQLLKEESNNVVE